MISAPNTASRVPDMTFANSDSLNTSDLQEKLRTAEQELERAEEGSEAERAAQRDKKRWEAFLRVAEGDTQ